MAKHALGLSIDEVYSRMVADAVQSHSYANRRKGESVRAWQKRARKRLLEVLGIDGRPKPAPKVRFTEEVPCDGYTRFRGYMLAYDELAVPFYMLVPDEKPAKKMGVCIAPHGHGPGKIMPVGLAPTPEDRDDVKQTERDYAVQAAKNGWLTIAPDLRGFGELTLKEDIRYPERGGRSCERLAPRAAQLGTSLMGQRASDLMQFVDYAIARKDVDSRRVVITGNSGGGMMTLFTAAVDTRIAAAAPSCYFSSFAASIMAMRHCNCNYVPGIQNALEHADLAGLVAPRPLLIINGTTDPIFPIDAVRSSFAEVKKIYSAARAASDLELFEGPGEHRYYAHRTWDFFDEKVPVAK